MKWFREVFLKSLIEQLEKRQSNQMWITEKQADICKKYMTQKSACGDYYIVVDGWQYDVKIMQKGYARFSKVDKRIAIR